MAVASIIVVFLVPGLAGWLSFGKQLRKHVSIVEAAFLIILGSVVTTSWAAITLAEFEMFSLSVLMIVLFVGSGLLSGWAVWNGRISHPFKNTTFSPLSLLILPILALTIWLSPQPNEYINGGRDHGLYVNTGIRIARTGSIFIYDTELASVPSESKQLLINPATSTKASLSPGPWSDGRRLPGGMTIRDLEKGIVTPQSFHLYPAWIAIFAAAGGVHFALMTTVILGILGVFSVYIAGARLFGQPTGLLASFLLAINLAQIWYTRTPSAEILLQPLFWGGLFTFVLMLHTNDRYTAVLAGLSFGLMHLAKLDTVFVFIILLAFLLYRWFRNQFPSSFWYFVIAYGLISLHAVLHAFFIATIYFLEQMTRVLLPDPIAQAVITAANGYNYPADILRRLLSQNAVFIAAGLIGLATLVFIARRFRQPIGQGLAFIERHAQRGKMGLSLVFVLLVMGIHLTPIIQKWVSATQLAPIFQLMAGTSDSQQFVTFIKWYLTPLSVFLSMVGLVQIASGHHLDTIIKKAKPTSHFVWLLLMGNILPFFILGAGTYPDQFWAIRRFVPIALPALILYAAYALWHLVPNGRLEWVNGLLPLGLIVTLIIGNGQNIRPFLGFTDYGGLIDQTAQIAASFPEDAVLLMESSFANGRVAAPLWQISGQTVFMLEEGAITDPDLLPAIAYWQQNGRAVYWLGAGSESPTLPGNIAAYYEGRRTWKLLWADRPVNRLPQHTGFFLNTVDVHRLDAWDTGERQSVMTIPIAWENEVTIPTEGLHDADALPGLTPRRWTSGQVIMHIPVSDNLSQIAMMMGNGRPGNIDLADVSIYLNDVHLDTIRVEGLNKTYNITLPSNLQFSTSTAELRLEMEPWIPAQTGYNKDDRQLGVLLDWIKLITTETK